jgi:uncharacterized membrane protein YhiD involved in acid resistance
MRIASLRRWNRPGRLRAAPPGSRLATLLLGLAWAPCAIASQAGPLSSLEEAGTRLALDVARQAVIALPIAAALGAMLGFRPRGQGAPPRPPEVVQTQVMLSLVGTLVMLVIGTSTARAFGILGAASLVRYRSKVSDPKDAGLMLSALCVGFACGIGDYALAAVATLFTLGVLRVLEWLQPRPKKAFSLKIGSRRAAALRPRFEALLRRSRVRYELRGLSSDQARYEVQLSIDRKTDGISSAIMDLDKTSPPTVEWQEAKA